jgi:8-oxo-dGTP diphosphatase
MINVTCAIIRNEDDEVLVVQRGPQTDHPYKWEFPGGKIAPGESEEDCIIREIGEELSIDIVICSRLESIEYDYGIKQILLIPFVCDTLNDLPLLSEHVAYKWLEAEELSKVDFSEADQIVAKQYLNEIRGDAYTPETVSTDHQSEIDDAELKSMINDMMSRQEVEWIATSAIDNPAIFNKLFEYSSSTDKKLAFRASWALTKVCDRFPELIHPYLSQIIGMLENFDNESAQRSFLRIISLTDFKMIPEKLYGVLADHCFRELNAGFSAIAIKAYSVEILYKLCLIYPELSNELYASVNMLQGEASAGVKARGQLILKKLANINPDLKSRQPES